MVDVVNTGTAPTGAAPAGHDEAMLAKVGEVEKFLEQQQTPAQESEKLLGKFNSVDDLAKAYQELERKMSSGKTEEKPQEQPKAAGELTEEKAQELVDKAGVNVDVMSEYFEQNGELSADHYAELEKAGIPKAYVDSYIAGLQAQAEQSRDAIMSEVGGQENFSKMAEWAQANLSQADLAAYNKAVDSGDMDIVKNAVRGLAYRYQQEAGRDPKLLNGGNATGAGFESVAQLVEAMKDPRYGKDPAYRREIEQKLARSSIM